MCGIVGVTAKSNVSDILLQGLKKLEYRGYDSAGIAVIAPNATIERIRLQGKVDSLIQAVSKANLVGKNGIAHTRWATHGIPSKENAHPFISSQRFALVHNGIIENFEALKKNLEEKGYVFTSQTDSEVIVHLLDFHYGAGNQLLKVVKLTIEALQGSFALGIICKDYPDLLIAVKKSSPLVIGIGTHKNYLTSDYLALATETQSFIFLEDHDIAMITPDAIQIYQQEKLVERQIKQIKFDKQDDSLGNFKHFMQKEIMEQPRAIKNCLTDRLTNNTVLPHIFGSNAQPLFQKVKHIQLVACGTSYHAALIGSFWIEEIAGISCSVEIASQFRYRSIAKPRNSLFVALSQSGETADTLAALEKAHDMEFLSTLAICNVPDSALIRAANLTFLTRAGVEKGVASTKSFITQILALLLLSLALRANQEKKMVKLIRELPELVAETLMQLNSLTQIVENWKSKQNMFFLGRGILYPLALEGSLKMKEIAYIHSEAYPAGELKHGPLALIDKNFPVVVLAPTNYLFEKTLSNVKEVEARGGEILLITDDAENALPATRTSIIIPRVNPLLLPFIYTLPLQLFAYHMAALRGNDVDQPRNLAKSVTVE